MKINVTDKKEERFLQEVFMVYFLHIFYNILFG